MKTETIICSVVIVALLCIIIRLATNQGKMMENYELVNYNNSERWRKFQRTPYVLFTQREYGLDVDKDWLGRKRYRIPGKDWFISKCNMLGDDASYSDGGCEDSMNFQRKEGACNTLWCYK